jgi:hypothetical protein
MEFIIYFSILKDLIMKDTEEKKTNHASVKTTQEFKTIHTVQNDDMDDKSSLIEKETN